MAQEILKDRPDLKRHIPTLICSKDIKYSTRHIRDVLGLREKKPGSEGSNPRLVRILIFVLLDPITSLEDPGKIIQAWKGCVDCHYHLWQAGLEHGDISAWNLMWDKNEQSSILNDFDLAVFRDIKTGKRITANNGERTGTIPFMALQLLTDKYYDGKIERQYRHELESFIWSLSWLCLYGAGDDVKEKLDQWRTADYITACGCKARFILELMDIVPQPGFEKLWFITRKLLRWVGRQYFSEEQLQVAQTSYKETLKKNESLYKDMEEIIETAEKEYSEYDLELHNGD
ncbi:hypothetical protein BDQ12DRAFT_729539 [Crucibulum laeve]|uniref:Fungal-type protein kinase domain-containing protein n=1 Tax=Crucibulum laeve TaxID=68775 RepID=A0A5C3LFG7_9AGAR|nr:hypothetical protein BDQ12DRAFT_729539 [Crucibulum laeve]